jgi:4-oxalocrotonate tautomerase
MSVALKVMSQYYFRKTTIGSFQANIEVSRNNPIFFRIIVKPYPGRSEEQKKRLADKIVKDVVAIAKCEEKSISVAIEEIKPEAWAEEVYRPDILGNSEKLYQKPGYNPFE